MNQPLTPKGQTANPRGKPEMRRVQAILNARYLDEEQAVRALDWARAGKDSTGNPVTDRLIIREALVALAEKYGWEFNPLPPLGQPLARLDNDSINAIANAVEQAVEGVLSAMAVNASHFATAENREAFKRTIRTSINEAITTSNLTGESFKFDEDE